MNKRKKCTLEQKLVQDNWFTDRNEILPWLMSRAVLADNQVMTSVSEKIYEDSVIRVKEYYKRRYVNKGGLKLEKALQDFDLDVGNQTALDCGASTGGFTDCLLFHGAKRVYAVDAGHGQLAAKLAQDPRVINLEKTNLGDPLLTKLEEPPSIITLDLSYLSLKKALPVCETIFQNKPGTVICLVKPLFEVESAQIRRSGQLEDELLFTEILQDLYAYFTQKGYITKGVTYSPVTGNKGTIEFFMHLALFSADPLPCDEFIHTQIKDAVQNGLHLNKFKKYYE